MNKHPLSMTSEELESMPIIRKVIANRKVCIYQPDIEFRKGWFAITFFIEGHLISCNEMVTFEGVDDTKYLEYLITSRVNEFNENKK